jgi:hypothetical protein
MNKINIKKFSMNILKKIIKIDDKPHLENFLEFSKMLY